MRIHEAILCRDCRYLHGYSEELGAALAICKAPEIVKERKKAAGIYPLEPQVLNNEADCRYFKPKDVT